MTEYVRDRAANPSINFPETEVEAWRAVEQHFRHGLNDPDAITRSLSKPFTDNAGFGMVRRPEQTRWLNEARVQLKARLEEALLEFRREDVARKAPIQI